MSPSLGGLFKAGGHPQNPGRKYPAPLFQRSQYICISYEGIKTHCEIVLIEIAEMISINPYIPQSWGTF